MPAMNVQWDAECFEGLNTKGDRRKKQRHVFEESEMMLT
jgi:hypothetical protein